MSLRIVVIGNGMVGYKFCQRLIANKEEADVEITVFGEEKYPAYDRVHLSEYFEHYSGDKLTLAPYEWYHENKINLKLGTKIDKILREEKAIICKNGEYHRYDILVLAMGSSPFVPQIEGVDKKGVFVYRTIDDLDGIKEYGDQIKKSGGKSVVLGGGLLGLEAAKATNDLGLDTSVVEFASWLMPRQIDQRGGQVLKNIIESLGIKILTGKNTTRIQGNGKIEGLEFSDHETIHTDMLVISAGIRPRDELARACGLDIGERGGVIVNRKMRTNDPSIYAIGEVACYQGMTYGLVAPGYEMAEVAVKNILSGEAAMKVHVDMSTKLKLLGVDVASFGELNVVEKDGKAIVFEDSINGIYKKILVSADGRHLLGGILIGDASQYNILLQKYLNKKILPEDPESLILGSRGGASDASDVLELPDEALICSCESVTKGNLCEAVVDGADSMKKLMKCTMAGTGCGGCKPMVKDLMVATLESEGKVVREVICEHFPYSRKELYDLIKIKKIRSYDDALDSVGSGDGCETCKPALASIFASLFSETPVKQETIQDTNDRFLANIQRNGTYSVVPRVPGGEITPDKLIVLGEVAKKYDLYTKITGGQRIDMFGAKVEELPLIWKELLDAGFESGHAYGKSLRTVKSCVGSTWCRFGLDESVSFAIELEQRYKGIRSPHKLKGGVSGCIRECAEARCKDFGVIATEKGWNLYVCGNGGANPKHAELLAENIDNETCIKYIDRFLSYYIKTAPPLTRTAPWLAKLEGGINYLKQVVIDDVLGLANEFEEHIESLVARYEDEWRQVVESEELQKRFRPFINTEESDDTLEFVALRDQKMPKQWN